MSLPPDEPKHRRKLSPRSSKITAAPDSKNPKAGTENTDDEISSIFILKAQPTSLVPAENYLRNRKWIVGSGTNLREALAYLIQKNPRYILISADHPNKKVRLLPRMLVQAFPVRVIGFAEKTSGSSTKNLHEMNLEYNLYPPVSGPAIQRMILKIKKDEETKEQEALINQSNRATGEDSGASDMITFKGQTPSEEAVKTSFEQARAALSQLVNSTDTTGGDETSQDSSSTSQSSSPSSSTASSSMINFQQRGDALTSSPQGPAYRGGPGSDPSQQGPSWVPSSKGSESSGDIGGMSSRTGHEGGSGGMGTGPSGGSLGSRGSSQDPTGSFNPSSGSGFQSGTSNWDSTTPSAHSAARPSSEREPNAEDPSSSETNPRAARDKSGMPIMESDYVPRSGPKPYSMRQEKEPAHATGQQSLFIRGAQQALNESTNLKNSESAQEIAQTSNLACIMVESARFSGYLVCAMGQNRKIDQDFTNILRQRLFRFLKDNGEEVREQDSLSLKIQAVDFTAWTLEQAEFLKKSVHDGDEIAIAFFPTAITSPDLQKSASEKMLKIHINELKGDAIVEFDLYIFMPENNKYLLYTPQGKPLYGTQRERLTEKGITHMHLRKETAHEMSKYRAQNFLNDKIEAYRAKLKS